MRILKTEFTTDNVKWYPIWIPLKSIRYWESGYGGYAYVYHDGIDILGKNSDVQEKRIRMTPEELMNFIEEGG